jgi:predicted phage tail protein
MQNLRSVALGITGIAVLALAAAFTVSLTLIAGAVLTLSLAARMLSPKRKTAPVYAKANKRRDEMRVWNDGRGTIIDL